MKYSDIIDKIYSWTANKKGETPIGNTILTLSFIHLVHLFVLLAIIDKLITPLPFLWNINAVYMYIGMPIYFVLFYFILYNKKRWIGYIEKYSQENDRQRKRGDVYVILFLIGSILLFFISLPVLCSVGRG